MSFSDEVDEVTKSILGFAQAAVRKQFPYLKTEALERVMEDTTADLRLRLAGQEQVIRAAQARTSFMSLSAELRNTIYEMTLRVEDDVDVSQKALVRRHSALLCVSRQIYDEARTIWYGINTFRFHVGDPLYWPSPFSELKWDRDCPQRVREWLSKIGSSACLVKCISLELTTNRTPRGALSDILC
ncbi:hypothetical protein CKM354_001178200 [Cercospora kikuchii]|uniref:Uncharacterized protein n=1 Tax=Cercospora kikuchii TaxID=84275 RepID=A0A9P3CSX0_9PEZI|nr:uncharacterized protein CKM354_001178200 [Cercospora kikuchii]GIZ48732.1 hypothetical protein CKM354_001178200 [Cercospora kikuchii]